MCIAIDQPPAEAALEALVMLADRRLSEIQPLRRKRESFGLGHHDEAAQLGEVKHITFLDKHYRLHRKTG